MKIEDNVITADEGKILRRISDRQEFGKELHLRIYPLFIW